MKLIRDKKKIVKSEVSEQQVIEKGPVMPWKHLKSLEKQSDITSAMCSSSWKILLVDDEPEIHAVTKLVVGDLTFEAKPLQLLNAMSGKEAQKILQQEPDIAVALIDVVMETENAGLQLISYIRNELNNQRIRLIIRTGQPGVAPERQIMDHYDIDDYKDKTELTAERLYTTLRTALKAYRDLTTIDINRQGLEKILTSAPNLYRIQPMEQFLEGVLTQMTSFCHIGEHSVIAMIEGTSEETEKSNIVIQAGTGKFSLRKTNDCQADSMIKSCERILQGKKPQNPLPEKSLLLPMTLYDQILGFIYLEDVNFLTEHDQYLLQVMVTQCAAALKNLRLYTHLEEANRQNERKNEFLGMAAHDLRSPLGVILSYVEILQEETVNILNKEHLDYLEQIQKASQFTLNLVSNLLDVAKIESGNLRLELEQISLISIITEAISLNHFLAESKHILLSLDYEENTPHAIIDAFKIQQVMNNLLSNAIKFSYPQTKIQINVAQQENNILISVADEGQGIPPSELDKLFKPFTMTSVKSTAGEVSTGLGLLICQQIINAHHGKIWVNSQVGIGSTFYVLFPLSPTNGE